MNLQIDEKLVGAARALRPLIEERSAEGERDRRLSKVTLDALREEGFLRLYVPRSLGGLEADPVTVARIVEEVAAGDSAAGWAIMVANSVAFWCRALPDEGPEEIYDGDPDAFIATAFHPPVTAVETDGGYRLTGRAPLASNIHAAPWVMLTALVTDDGKPRMVDGNPIAIGAVMRTADVEIADTWHTMGMRGTDSCDVSVSDVLVPARRTFVFDPGFTPGGHYRGDLYRMPALGAALAPWAGVSLAIARNAIDEVCSIAQGKTPFNSSTTLSGRAGAQAKAGRAEAMLASGRLMLLDAIDEAWRRTCAGVESTLEQKAYLLMAAVHATQSATEAVELMHRTAGTTGIYARNPLERHFRDIHVLRQHGFLNESRYETVGQVLFGLDPDLGLVVF